MPTYAYRCTACSHDFEIVQAISDSGLTTCPECGGALRKVFHPVGVAFKGSGFYRTDSRAASAKGSTNSGKESGDKPAAASSGDGSSAGSSDSASSKASTADSASKKSTESSKPSSSSSGSGSSS